MEPIHQLGILPLNGYVFVKQIEDTPEKSGAFYQARASSLNARLGKVVATSDKKRLSVGDAVLFPINKAEKVLANGVEYMLVSKKEVFAVFPRTDEFSHIYG